ncbi:MAG: hypothetical protein JNJ83_10605 [Verrucomicrobiaceae bacterium]|nr:hypothetical protein [Verrucomicrobiaceae bacterium]
MRSALSNYPDRCEVIDLAWNTKGHGPYLVRQHGYSAIGSDFVTQPYILQKDGTWLLNLAFALLPEKYQEKQLFQSLAEVIVFFEKLCTEPVKVDAHLPPNADPAQVLANFERCTHRILMGLRNGVASSISSTH